MNVFSIIWPISYKLVTKTVELGCFVAQSIMPVLMLLVSLVYHVSILQWNDSSVVGAIKPPSRSQIQLGTLVISRPSPWSGFGQSVEFPPTGLNFVQI